jgi:hypothetical protein
MIKLGAMDRAALARVAGIGDAKIASYGEEILRVISQTLVPASVEDRKSDKESEP